MTTKATPIGNGQSKSNLKRVAAVKSARESRGDSMPTTSMEPTDQKESPSVQPATTYSPSSPDQDGNSSTAEADGVSSSCSSEPGEKQLKCPGCEQMIPSSEFATHNTFECPASLPRMGATLNNPANNNNPTMIDDFPIPLEDE